MRVLVVGARSKTTEALLRQLRRRGVAWDVRLISHRREEPMQVHGYPIYVIPNYARQPLKNLCFSWEPDVIVNTAALTDVDACERNRELAWQRNVELVATLVGVCRVLGARLLQVSSDYVFDGSKGPYAEHECPRPINYYGKTKLAAENLCQTALLSVLIVRTTHIYGTPAPWCHDILRWAFRKARRRERISVACDVYTNPILVDDLAQALICALQGQHEGIIHVGGDLWESRYDFLRRAFELAGLSIDLLEPVPASELYRNRAPRPRYAGLRYSRAESLWGFAPTPHTEALLRVLQRTYSGDSGDSTE